MGNKTGKKEESKDELSFQTKVMERLKALLFTEISYEGNDVLTEEDGWKRIPFEVEDIKAHIPCIYREAKNPQAVIAFCTGMKASTASYKNVIKGLNDKGFTVVVLNLPFPEKMRREDFYGEYKKIVRKFYTDPSSPVYTVAREIQRPVFAMTHSTGGLLFTDMMLNEPEFNGFVKKHIIGAVHMCPFFGASNAAKDFNGALSKLFKRYAEWRNDTVLGDSFIEIPYLLLIRIIGSKTITDRAVLPAFNQIRELIRQGERVVDSLKGNMAMRSFPHCFIVSKNDPMACPKTAGYVASKLPAQIRNTKGFHDPLEGNEALLNQLAAVLNEQTQKHEATTLPPDPNAPAHEQEEQEKKSLGSRLLGFVKKDAAPTHTMK